MAKVLNLDDMLGLASDLNLPGRDGWQATLETIGTEMAREIAAKLGIANGDASFEQGFGGTCATFRPAFDEQPCPDELTGYDDGGDWD